MTVRVRQVHLLNVERCQPEPAELWDAVTEQQLTDWENEWVPELLKAIERLEREGIESRHWPQSSHWNWRKKVEALRGMLASPGFSIVCDGLTQGMMIVDTVKKRCRIDNQKGKPLVYVEFVENAPWNRRELCDSPRYRGVGSILMRAAIELSVESEFGGRIGLHSLSQAHDFYAYLWHDGPWRRF
ncbi:MAG: hypothetical protein OXB94_06120 [Nitrospira sp.]|nr:hypothetical protein [Nitrospira sp.]